MSTPTPDPTAGEQECERGHMHHPAAPCPGDASEGLSEAIGMSLYESLMEASADQWRRWEFMTDAAKEKYRAEAARIVANAVEPLLAARESAAATRARAEERTAWESAAIALAAKIEDGVVRGLGGDRSHTLANIAAALRALAPDTAGESA